jgi:hypothetical protein
MDWLRPIEQRIKRESARLPRLVALSWQAFFIGRRMSDTTEAKRDLSYRLPEYSMSLPAEEDSSLVASVKALEKREQEASDLLGEIIATLSIPRNRESFAPVADGEFLRIADRWIERYKRTKEW